jgi:hypothetical protein
MVQCMKCKCKNDAKKVIAQVLFCKRVILLITIRFFYLLAIILSTRKLIT